MAIGFYVNNGTQVQIARVAGAPLRPYTPGSRHFLPEDTVGKWSSIEQAFTQNIKAETVERYLERFNIDARENGFKSWMIVPIRWRDETIGDLLFRSYEEDAFSEREIGLATLFADKVTGTVATTRVISEARLESSLRGSLLELSRLVSSVRSLDEIQDQFGKIACSLVDADRVAIALPVSSGTSINNVLVYGHEVKNYGVGVHSYPASHGSIPWLSIEQPYIVDESVLGQSRATRTNQKIVIKSGLMSTLVAPIVWQGNSIAAITFHARARNAFSKFHLETASAIASQVAGTIANQIAYQELGREAEVREVLARIGRAITSSDDLAPMFPEIKRILSSIIEFEGLSIGSYDRDTRMYQDLHSSGAFVDGKNSIPDSPLSTRLLVMLLKLVKPRASRSTRLNRSSTKNARRKHSWTVHAPS